MGFEKRFSPLNDLMVQDRKLVKFLDQGLFGCGLVGAGFHEQG